MKITQSRKGAPGYVSVLLVLSSGLLLTMLTVFAYRGSVASQAVQTQVQLRTDYMEKEEEILRAVVAIAPNRAIRAMQHNSASTSSISTPLRWRSIFTEAITLANARTSVTPDVLNSLAIENGILSNPGDSAAINLDVKGIVDNLHGSTGVNQVVTAGVNQDLGTSYPPSLNGSSDLRNQDRLYPIISNNKVYGALASGRVGLPTATYSKFNQLEYPQIGFGYASPGDLFVAKRNWWAFSMDASSRDAALTGVTKQRRHFTLSIFEIPSQLAISAEAFLSLGRHASGESWQHTSIQGNVFAGRAVVEGDTALDSLASRRGMDLAATATIGGRTFDGNPFAPGVRENFLLTEGDFFPVSRASDSGRAAFVPINRGPEFFDRFAHAPETQTLSDTTWNTYSVGALQAAMRLDVVAVQSSTNMMPTRLRFGYLLPDGTSRQNMTVAVSGTLATLPPGFVKIRDENQSINFATAVDVAYGAPGGFAFRNDVSGPITFNNATFGDPLVGTFKGGYWRPRAPFRVKEMSSGRLCIGLYPQRFPAFLTAIGAGAPAINHSASVNVDYSTTGLNNPAMKPRIPTTDLDYGVILEECADLTPFTKGFSLVTNLRLFIGDDFNTASATPPAGYTPSGAYYPPCSLFAPEKRYGVEDDPFAVNISGQLGSLAKGHKVNVGDAEPVVVRPLESRGVSEEEIDASRIVVNLRPITHPAELPPITMMNWLVVVEEKRGEFQ